MKRGDCAALSRIAGLTCGITFLASVAGVGAPPTQPINRTQSGTVSPQAAYDQRVEAIQALVKAGDRKAAEADARRLLADMDRAEPDSLRSAEAIALIISIVRPYYQVPDLETLAQRAVDIRKRVQGSVHPAVAASLATLALIVRDRHDFAMTKSLLQQALAIEVETLGPEHAQVGYTLYQLGTTAVYSGDWVASKDFMEKSLAIREKALGPEDSAVGVSLHGVGLALTFLGETERAVVFYERALKIKEKTLGPDSEEVAYTLMMLGQLRRERGDIDGASEALNRAYKILQTVFGPDHPKTLSVLSPLAEVLYAQGAWAEARALVERQVAGRQDSGANTHAALELLGTLLLRMGELDAARRVAEEDLALDVKLFGREQDGAEAALELLTQVDLNRGDLTRAENSARRAIELSEALWGREHPRTFLAQALLAEVQFERGDLATARAFWEQCVDVRLRVNGPTDFKIPQCLSELANIIEVQGSFEEARVAYQKIVDVRTATAAASHPDFAAALGGLARTEMALARFPEALLAASQAESVRRTHMLDTISSLAERPALDYAAGTEGGLAVLLSLSERPGGPPASTDAAWRTVIQSRALVLDEMAARHRQFTATSDPETTRFAGAFSSASKRLANLVVRGPRDEPEGTFRTMVENARRERDEAERSLAQRSVQFREDRARSQVTPEQIVAALPPDTALVSFVRFDEPGPRFPAGSSGRRPAPITKYLAFVLGPTHNPTVVPLGLADPIDRLVEAYQRQLRQAATSSGLALGRLEASYRETAGELRRKIWDPLEVSLGHVTKVFIVPDGMLHLIDFSSLPMGPSKYLIEAGPVIHYLSAERDLVAPAASRPATGLLVMGAPAFSDTSAVESSGTERTESRTGSIPVHPASAAFRGQRATCGSFQKIVFDDLPGSQREVNDVAALWRQSSGVAGLPPREGIATGAVEALRGAAATEGAFKTEAPGKRVLHLATHGFFLGRGCPSALDRRSTGASPSTAGSGENPLLLSGLALAGANRRVLARPQDEDGILTSEEIAALDLGGVEWAVLSACDTGVGEIRAGEGVFGLRRAFQVAGVRTLIMSLWPVDDEATSRWMTRLYRHRLLNGRATIDAVHNASLDLLHARRAQHESTHPFFWAGFVAAGDWR